MNSSYKNPDLKNVYYDEFLESIQSLNNLTIAITGTTSGTGYVAAQTVASNWRFKRLPVLRNTPSI